MSEGDNKDNKENIQIYYLCNDTDSDKDNYCKELIKMINVIVLNTLLKDPSYINKSNQLGESVINNKIDELTRQLIVNSDTEDEYTEAEAENYRKKKMKETSKLIEEFQTNLYNNGIGQDMGEGMEHSMLSNAIENLPHNIPHNIPRVGGNKRKSNKKTHKNRKTYKKSKRIRKI
jgi:hypothetical protein